MRKIFITLILLTVVTVSSCGLLQRNLLFHPTHHKRSFGLQVWENGGKTLGYARKVNNPENVWLMLHGNAGQAADRVYALDCFSDRDTIYILEYPGFGQRSGNPARSTINAAAIKGYELIRNTYPGTPICVVGESIGSGPASVLGGQRVAPDKIVLVTPYDKLSHVTSQYIGTFLSAILLEAKWDNIKALENYNGIVEVYGALEDQVIPVSLAKNLAESVPNASFNPIPGGHNDWASGNRVQFRHPSAPAE